MWITTNKGLFSIVQHRDKHDMVLVRARAYDHIKYFEARVRVNSEFAKANIKSGMLKNEFSGTWVDRKADYPHRMEVSKDLVGSVLSELAQEIDYTNFKDSVKDPKMHSAYMDAYIGYLNLDDRSPTYYGDSEDKKS